MHLVIPSLYLESPTKPLIGCCACHAAATTTTAGSPARWTTWGERWALLIVRELLAGPRRYSDLLADLPGISTDVLATRLRQMESDGLVIRARAGARTYQLTETGAAVAPILDALSDWGLTRLGPRAAGDAVRGHWFAAPLARRLRPLATAMEHAGSDRFTVQVELKEPSFHLVLDGDGVRHVDGPAPRPDAVLTTDAQTAAALAAGRPGRRRRDRRRRQAGRGGRPYRSAARALASATSTAASAAPARQRRRGGDADRRGRPRAQQSAFRSKTRAAAWLPASLRCR